VDSNSIYVLSAVVVALVAIITLYLTTRGARDKRIASETKVADALDKNSEATNKLTDVVQGILETQQAHTVELARHDLRISTLEKQPSVSVNVGPQHPQVQAE
jgi:hypothetical protein